MPRKGKGNDKGYLEVLKSLQDLIERDYDDGGWLPSGRKLSEQLGADRKTLLKAIECVKRESLIQSFPHKGYLVAPRKFRMKKVGVVFSHGQTSPFLGDMSIINRLNQLLQEQSYYFHLIQGNSFEEIFNNAQIHGVKAMVFFDFKPDDIESFEKVSSLFDLPSLIISKNIFPDLSNYQCNCIAPDFKKSNDKKLDLFESKGHRHIAYVTCNDIGFNLFRDQAAERDIETIEINYNTGYDNIEIGLMEHREVTAIIIDGGSRVQDEVCRQLMTMGNGTQIELFIFSDNQSPEILNMYPDISVIGMGEINASVLADEAAKQLIACLDNGSKLTSHYVDWLKIIEFSERKNANKKGNIEHINK